MNDLTGEIGPGPVAVIGRASGWPPPASDRARARADRARARDDLGGQWNVARRTAECGGDARYTSRTTTAFSDFPLGPAVATLPRADQVHLYLREYAGHFGVLERIRTGARVTAVDRRRRGLDARWSQDGAEHAERFAGVVVASGRFGAPRFRDPGLARLRVDGRLLALVSLSAGATSFAVDGARLWQLDLRRRDRQRPRRRPHDRGDLGLPSPALRAAEDRPRIRPTGAGSTASSDCSAPRCRPSRSPRDPRGRARRGRRPRPLRGARGRSASSAEAVDEPGVPRLRGRGRIAARGAVESIEAGPCASPTERRPRSTP